MKKILLVLIASLVLVLSGCDDTPQEKCDFEGFTEEVFEELEDLSQRDYTYTYEVNDNGDLIEYKDGVYNETITVEDVVNQYCESEE